jgi:uncharacterized OB-fold protein
MVLDISDEELVVRFKGHPIDRDNAEHYRGRLERQLRINRCKDCGTWNHPPIPTCPTCWSLNVEAAPVSGDGTIYLVVFLHQGPPAEGVDYSVPYPVVTVELDEKVRFTTTIVGANNDEIEIGKRVSLDWIERTATPLPVFRLQTSKQSE